MDDHLTLLTGDDVGQILAAGVGGAGGEVLSWTASTVHHRPGSLTTAAFRATVRWGDRIQEETLVASVGGARTDRATPGVVVLGDGVDRVALWRFPSDPALPGLAVAADPTRLAVVLAGMGVPGFTPTSGRLELRVRTYRPCRRAVIQVDAPGGGGVFVRVMEPSAAAALHDRHVLLHAAGVPVPRSFGATEDGILVVEAIPGPTLRDHPRTGGPAVRAEDLLGLLDRLPDATRELSRRRAWADEARHYAAVVGSPLPAERDRATELAEVIAAGLSGLQPDSATHGDFHDAQLIMQGASIRGLLDVDTAGPGRRADDVATLLGHLEASVLGGAPHPERLRGLVAQWQLGAEAVVDPAELRLRVAGVLLSLATGPFRIQQQGWPAATTLHLDAVQRWVESSQQLQP